MGNTNSSNSTEFFENASDENQAGGNAHKQLNDLDLSFLDSEGDYEQAIFGGSINNNYNNYNNSDESIRTEDFISLLKSKIDNLNDNADAHQNHKNQQNQHTQNLSLSETSEMSDTSVFLNNNQSGGNLNENETDIQTIMKAAKQYLKQYGGGSDDESSDDDLDDSDDSDGSDASDTSDKKKKNPVKRATNNDTHARAGKSDITHKQNKLTQLSDSIQLSDTAVSSESIASSEYKTNSSESFGKSESDTPYMQSDSINTSSINLVSFENPALTTNVKKARSKTKAKRVSRY